MSKTVKVTETELVKIGNMQSETCPASQNLQLSLWLPFRYFAELSEIISWFLSIFTPNRDGTSELEDVCSSWTLHTPLLAPCLKPIFSNSLITIRATEKQLFRTTYLFVFLVAIIWVIFRTEENVTETSIAFLGEKKSQNANFVGSRFLAKGAENFDKTFSNAKSFYLETRKRSEKSNTLTLFPGSFASADAMEHFQQKFDCFFCLLNGGNWLFGSFNWIVANGQTIPLAKQPVYHDASSWEK